MKNKIFSFIAIANMLLASSTTIIAANDSTISTKEVVIQKVENARKKTHDVKEYIDERINDTIINTHDIAINHSSNEKYNFFMVHCKFSSKFPISFYAIKLMNIYTVENNPCFSFR